MEIIENIKKFINDDKLAPHEIRSGSGDVVCAIILGLTEAALKNQEIKTVVY